ncbi:hypothetical protein LguiA_027131 [Lonicera macranthoides]
MEQVALILDGLLPSGQRYISLTSSVLKLGEPSRYLAEYSAVRQVDFAYSLGLTRTGENSGITQ